MYGQGKYPLYIFKDKRIRMAGLIFGLLILAAASVFAVADRGAHTYNTTVLVSGGETSYYDLTIERSSYKVERKE